MEAMEATDIQFQTITSDARKEFANIRANRPSAALVESLPVEYMEGTYTIRQLGSISILPPRTIAIAVWDAASAPAVAKAIEASSIGVKPAIEGILIRFTLPPLTDERREELIRSLKRLAEDFRIRIRTRREEINKKIESDFKAKLLTEDGRFKAKKRVQAPVLLANAHIEQLPSQDITLITL